MELIFNWLFQYKFFFQSWIVATKSIKTYLISIKNFKTISLVLEVFEFNQKSSKCSQNQLKKKKSIKKVNGFLNFCWILTIFDPLIDINNVIWNLNHHFYHLLLKNVQNWSILIENWSKSIRFWHHPLMGIWFWLSDLNQTNSGN